MWEEFWSEAYEELVISMREERRSMQWHGGLGNPPAGGWELGKTSIVDELMIL